MNNRIIIPSSLEGRIRLNSRDQHDHKTELCPWFPNMILNQGLDQIAQINTYLDCCHVGRSGNAVLPNQTGLQDWAAAVSNRISANSITTTSSPYFGISQITYRFPVGAVTGTLREIGFGAGALSSTPLFNRALITDAFGDPSITAVPSNEHLEVDYELALAAPVDDIHGTIMHDGNPINYTVRPAHVASTGYWSPYRAGSFALSGQAVRALFSVAEPSACVLAFESDINTPDLRPGGVGSPARWITVPSYVPGSHQAMIRAEWDINEANFAGGIRSLLWFMNTPTGAGGNTLGAYQIQFETPIMKTDKLSYRIDLGISWGRVS